MSSSPQYSHCLPNGTVIKDYRIEKVLGKGGFGITYLAEDVRLKKLVAIKELLPDGIAARGADSSVIAQSSSQEEDYQWAIDSFLKEAQTLAGFEHPNIVRIYRLFEEHNTAYMVMPFVEGVSLKDVVARRKSLPYEEVKKIITQLLDGLEVVHQLDTLHRDIKPDNIIIMENGNPMLIDFGAARQTITGKTQDVTSIITPGYAPVEQYSTDARYQGPWSDIYAMAAVAFFMITGKKPTPASERSDAMRNMRPDPMPKLAELAPAGYPPHFLAAVDTALQMSEQLRPQAVPVWRDLLLGQQPAAAGPPAHPPAGHGAVPAAPAPRPAANAKKGSKKAVLVAALCGMIALLLGGGGFVTWKLLSDDGGEPDPEIAAKFTKVEAYLDVNKPLEAKSLIDSIDRGALAGSQSGRYDELSEKTDNLIKNATSTLSIEVDPDFATTEIDGAKVVLSNGSVTVRGLGGHTLRASADGYQSRSVNFECREPGDTINLSKITLTPAGATRSLARLIDDLEDALKKENFPEVKKLAARLKDADPPSHMRGKVDELLEKSTKFIDGLKWQVAVATNPSSAVLHLNGKRVFPYKSRFKVDKAGRHKLEVSAQGYQSKTVTFNMAADGSPHDIGTVVLEKEKQPGDDQVAKIGTTKREALRVARAYVAAGNSPNTPEARLAYINERCFYGGDQKKQKQKGEIKEILEAYNKRWKTRKFTVNGEVTVTAHDSGGSWVVTVPYALEHSDGLFTLKAKRHGKFAIMGINGKPLIVAHKEFMLKGENDVLEPIKGAIVPNLKKFNIARLTAGDSDGGKTVEQESLYYANSTEYYGPRILNREQIRKKIRENRAKSDFRAYLVKSHSDFIHMNRDDPTGRTFSFKCVVEVTKDTGKRTRTERVTVKYINGVPYVTSVRY